ncbi:tetratricopeptide repeat protein [Flavobacterium sp. ANB]|uniref:tetratricopeptide repeat protein n=1 Tax=unclassified Flavobacterium TaxID=196869 RepID=UPI0012B94046|nr:MULTISPECIES: tetratricopeptide repeat protein [unclassified Flavobacterium]MBF4515081.1 tetratricopeptide repeat protein [Flavobacterium sp. ANB]MTD69993.1 tetratricopeptide repeat protein [Flavobacterium sp. LC2016-13]
MNEERYILFDQYLQDEMTVEEKNSFEKQLAEDQEFAATFETFKAVNLQLENKFGYEMEREVFKENLTKISNKHFNANKPKVIPLRPWHYGVAASAVILIGLLLYNYNQNPAFEDFNHPEKAYFTERSDADAVLKQAEAAFNSEEYKEAVPLFESILKTTNTPEIQYFYGVSLLEANQIKKAENVFNTLKSGTSVYKDKATWNLALIKLKQKDYEACKEILLTIPQDYEDYVEVQILLKELE